MSHKNVQFSVEALLRVSNVVLFSVLMNLPPCPKRPGLGIKFQFKTDNIKFLDQINPKRVFPI